ncbi:MAG: D-alanine--D-alanine ligase [Proteobacteria bacterium]|nr:D-alanine--D-alanine ligase [Pseudomonadota bacterium]
MRVGVIYGGISKEREISIKTGTAISKALKEKGYEVVDLLVKENMVEDILKAKIDVAFIALHGRYGEDGTVQGLLELLKIPYTGASVLASAIGIDKIMTKIIWQYYGILTPKFQVIRDMKDERNIHFPLVVKSPREGSTIGVYIVNDEEEYKRALSEVFKLDDEVLLEEYVKGAEITVSVIDDMVLTPIEIRPKKGFYDFHSKYTKGETEYLIPPQCKDEVIEKMKDTARKAYKAIKCSGSARVDFILTENDESYALEINTIPGMTETSLLPKSADYHGIPFQELVEIILKKARLHNSYKD